MADQLDIVPISRVFDIIDSCINEAQLNTCRQLSLYYTQMAKEKGVVNTKDVKKVLDRKIQEKLSELCYIEEFA